MMIRVLGAACLAASVSACGGSSTQPAPALVTLTGTVTASGTGPVAGAVVTVLDGPNLHAAAQTDSAGHYVLTGLEPGNANLSAADGVHTTVVKGIFINGTNTLDFTFAALACQINNTGDVRFNTFTSQHQDFIWDGGLLFTLAAGQTSPFVAQTAGVPHTLNIRVAGTQTAACADSAPILVQCQTLTVELCRPVESVSEVGPCRRHVNHRLSLE